MLRFCYSFQQPCDFYYLALKVHVIQVSQAMCGLKWSHTSKPTLRDLNSKFSMRSSNSGRGVKVLKSEVN